MGYSVQLVTLNRKANGRLLGVRLGRTCIKHGISVVSVAAELGVSRQTIYNWFSGVNAPFGPRVETVKALIAAYK